MILYVLNINIRIDTPTVFLQIFWLQCGLYIVCEQIICFLGNRLNSALDDDEKYY